MKKGLNIKDRHENIYFDSSCASGVDCHYDNEFSSGENGKYNGDDSCHEPKSNYDRKREEINADDMDEDGSPQDDFESDSYDEW